jgi:hypothetical protein
MVGADGIEPPRAGCRPAALPLSYAPGKIGGWGRIRTCGTYASSALAPRCLKPLGHPSSGLWCVQRDSNPRGRGFGDRRSAAELHLFRKPPNKKAASVLQGGLPIWGLSSVVSRHRQAHLAAREGTEHRVAQPILAAVFGERWNVHHDEHGAELLAGRCAKSIEINVNNRFIVALTPPQRPSRR